MKKYSMFIILLTVFLSCSRQSEYDKELKHNTEEIIQPKIEMIQIEFCPSFETNSMLTLLVNERKIVFQRIGRRDKGGFEPLDGSEYVKTFSPASFCFTINNQEFSTIDSILNEFSSLDYNDQFEKAYDGRWMSVSMTYSNDSIIDFELFNNMTENQYLLIYNLTRLCLSQETDSLTKEYLKKI